MTTRVRDYEDQDHQREEPKHAVEAVLDRVFGCQHVSSSQRSCGRISSRVSGRVLERSGRLERVREV